MDLDSEVRASARSDEPEARSAARWRVRAVGDPSAARDEAIVSRWPLLGSSPVTVRWLVMQIDLGRSPRTVESYARALVDFIGFCERHGVDVLAAGRAEIAGYVRDLR